MDYNRFFIISIHNSSIFLSFEIPISFIKNSFRNDVLSIKKIKALTICIISVFKLWYKGSDTVYNSHHKKYQELKLNSVL